jgi:hypothetical protein
MPVQAPEHQRRNILGVDLERRRLLHRRSRLKRVLRTLRERASERAASRGAASEPLIDAISGFAIELNDVHTRLRDVEAHSMRAMRSAEDRDRPDTWNQGAGRRRPNGHPGRAAETSGRPTALLVSAMAALFGRPHPLRRWSIVRASLLGDAEMPETWPTVGNDRAHRSIQRCPTHGPRTASCPRRGCARRFRGVLLARISLIAPGAAVAVAPIIVFTTPSIGDEPVARIAGHGCGHARWRAKTLSDEQRTKVDFRAKTTTLSRPARKCPSNRVNSIP